MREFGWRQCAGYRDPDGWLDSHYLSSAAKAFPGFVEAMGTPEAAIAIKNSIYWYLGADMNAVGPDGGIILLQAALEALISCVAYEYKLKVRKGARFAENLFQALTALSIPTELAAKLEQLHDFETVCITKNAPHVFAEIRNNLVHPKNKYAGRKLPHYEAYVLGKWWIELMLLHLFEYNGPYANRTTRTWIGEVEPVPWASQP